MDTMEVYFDGRIWDVIFYTKKSGHKKYYSANVTVAQVINALMQPDKHLTNFKSSKYDKIFEAGGFRVVLKEYEALKKIPMMQELREKINLSYRKELVKNKEKYARRRLGAGILVSLPLIGLSVSKTINFSKAEEKGYIKLPDYSSSDYIEDDYLDDEYTFNDEAYEQETSNVDSSVDNKDEINEEVIKQEQVTKEDYYVENKYSVDIDYEDRSTSIKAENTKNAYGSIIEKYANMYGVDPNLMIALATQERGVHSDTIDAGGAIGLMQIEYKVWNNQTISAYNYETGEKDTITIDDNAMKDLYTNIKLGCMIMQANLKAMDNNPIAALQSYNYGYGNMMKVINTYATLKGKTKDEILNDPSDLGWMAYRNIIEVGDKEYIEHVLSYLGEQANLEFKTEAGIVDLAVNDRQKVR